MAEGGREIDLGYEGGARVTLTFVGEIKGKGVLTKLKYFPNSDLEYKQPKLDKPLWNGEGELVLINVPQGKYRTYSSGDVIPNRVTFEVNNGDKNCAWRLTNKKWAGSCK